ncbi:hypothetical protein G6F35_005524 [Rhizopus arrhizus]|nr:hypothetical protein G6F35_005524 [Rhizopus arrhizus]
MYIPSLSTIAITALLAASTAVQVAQADVDLLSWEDAYTKAKVLVNQMSLEQKVNITTGTLWQQGPCVGNTHAITNPEFPSLCLQDAPLGVRYANNVTVGVAGINAAASFDRKAIYDRGVYMGDVSGSDSSTYFGKNLTEAVENKKVKESRVTDMATRIVATWYRFRQDENYPETKVDSFDLENAPYVNVQADHYKLVREMGAASTVLLKNNGILPLKNSVKNIAFIGSDAAVDPNGLNVCEDQSCDNGTLAIGWGSGSANFPYLIDPITGLTNALGKDVSYKKHLDNWDVDSAADVAKDADVAFVFSNSDSGEQYLSIDGNVGDRNNLSLWNNGDNLIKAVADANKNTVVVIHSVGPVIMPWVDHPNIKAIVWPGLPGQESGNSLADIITVLMPILSTLKNF